jgi:ElaB/YqjD/DUF883 family membrane-anchored ribosome-binding protein
MTTKHSHANNESASADLADAAADLAGVARNRLTAVFENTKEFVTNVRDKAVASARATDKTVHENPYKSIAIAAGVGVLLGFILARRRACKKSADQD